MALVRSSTILKIVWLQIFICFIDVTESNWAFNNTKIYSTRLNPYKKQRDITPEYCPRDEAVALQQGRTCLRKCINDEDCKSKRKKCICDGICGLSCINPEKDCGDPEQPPELGSVHVTGKHFGSKAIYSCPQGFRIIGVEERVCQADGVWSDSTPVCKKNIFCSKPPIIENARHNAPLDQKTFSMDTSLQYQCLQGYVTKGFARSKCFFYNGTAKWFGPDIVCEPRNCPEPVNILNGLLEVTCHHFNCKLTYKCQPGFELLGKSEQICQADATWTPSDLPTCVPVQCPIPENPVNGKAVFSSVTFNSYVQYECKYGYMLVSEGGRRCGHNKKWSGNEPQCKEINCGSPGTLYNGWLEGSRTTLHAVIIFHCLQETTYEGASDRTVCQSDGKWSHPLPKCYAPCTVPQVPFGNVTSSGGKEIVSKSNETSNSISIILHPQTIVPHGRAIGVECEKKYEHEYSITPSTCYNGSWTNAPKCQPAKCKGLPKAPRHGIVIAPKTDHGMKARYTCRDGFTLIGHNVTECQYGEWIGEPPVCSPTYCKYPGSIPNGKVLLVGNMGLYDYRNYVTKVANNRQITFDCNKGYVLSEGPLGKTCIDGEWSPKADVPKCVPSQHPNFRWIRRKRRAIKTGGGSIVRNKAMSGGGATGARRGSRRKKVNDGEDDYDPSPLECEDLSEDPYIHYEVIESGEEFNISFSSGTVLKVSCKTGYGVNLPNATVQCVHGNWKPVPPQCDALPCRVPHIWHGSFFNASIPSKGVYFQESVKHTKQVELRCRKGYTLKGPNLLTCWYGEWDVNEPPDCVPDSCLLPELEDGKYIGDFKELSLINHETKVDYICNGEFRKIVPGPSQCYLGFWKPNKPHCFHPSIALNYTEEKNSDLSQMFPFGKKSCGQPQRVKGAITFADGKPVDYDKEFTFTEDTYVLYKCVNQKNKQKNRWKVSCEQGKWIGEMLYCEGEVPDGMVETLLKFIDAPCLYDNEKEHVVTFYENQEILKENIEFPSNAYLTSRCTDIGKYELKGAMLRKCVSTQWLGIKPSCEGLSQANDYALDRPPTILFRYENGSIVQSNDGKLVLYPGTTLHMECIWMRKFGKPRWDHPNDTFPDRQYKIGWTDGIDGRSPSLEFRLTIDNAQNVDTGTYTCTTPSKHSHQIEIIVKEVSCPPHPEISDLIFSTTDLRLGSLVKFKCDSGNAVVGPDRIYCTADGQWSGPYPRCENVECPDISLLPAMAPLAYTSVTKNGTLVRNETAPPKITLKGRSVGSKAIFTCPQGFIIHGSSEATCLNTSDWSSNIPLCKEVECGDPSPPENGHISNPKNLYKAGDFATFECNKGYMMESSQNMIACQDSGQWSRISGLKCVQACTYPGTVFGGKISEIRFYYRAQETVTFDCPNGTLVGARMIHCMKNGKWSNSVPTCIPGTKGSNSTRA